MSVISQEGDFYIDYIIADGDSTDKSVEIIKKYDLLLKNCQFPIKCRGVEFRWWSKKDNGEAAAVNEAFRKADGDILAWIASDDFYEPDAFNTVEKKFSGDKAVVLVHGDTYHYYDKNKKTIARSTETSFDDLLKKGNVISMPSVFFLKRAFDEVGFLNEHYKCVIDLDLWLRLSRVGKLSYVPKILGNFRVWEKSKSVYLADRFGPKERKEMLIKYGGRRIDPKLIYQIKSRTRLAGYVHDKMPRLYYFIKRSFYKVLDAFSY